MIGATASADQFATRSANHSTKASRTGRNLLGWEVDETLTLEQQRDVARHAYQQLQQRLTEIKAEFLTAKTEPEIKRLRKERGQAVDRLPLIVAELSKLKEATRKKDDIGSHIVEIFRERVTKHEWACIVAEAERRFEAVQ